MTSRERRLPIDYDEVLAYIGQFGSFQRRLFLLLSLCSAGAGLAVVVFAFTALEPEYRCQVTKCGENNNSTYYTDQLSPEPSLPAWYNGSIALSDRCRVPQVSTDLSTKQCTNQSALFPEEAGEGEEECSFQDLVIDRSIVTSSLVEQFQFTCGRQWQRTVYNAVYMAGMLVGSFFFGWFSDSYGRMKSLMLAVVTTSLTGFLGAFCGVHGYGFFRFITGMGGIGMFMVCFVLIVEHVGHKFTMLIGIAIEIPFALGEALLSFEAFFIRDWPTLQMVAYLPLLGLLSLWWLVPESPRWLVGSGNLEKAKEVIRKAARVNGTKVPEHLLSEEFVEIPLQDGGPPTARSTVFDLFRPTTMAVRTLNMCFQWFSVTMCYYGLSFASTSLSSGGPYVNFLLSVLVEIPGYIFCLVVMDCWGRRPILSFCQAISGIACIFCGLMQGSEDENILNLQVFLSLVGKFGASASFAIVYVYTAELFPTVIRNQAVGTCSLVARIGGIASLMLDNLKVYWLPAPVFIMGLVATAAGVLAFFLPETLGNKLPETLEEALRIGSETRRGFCSCTCVSVSDMFSEELRTVPSTKEGKMNRALDLEK